MDERAERDARSVWHDAGKVFESFLPPSHPNSRQSIERDLDLLASEAIILVEPEKLLKKPRKGQGAGFRTRLNGFKEDARRQMQELGRSKLDKPSPVSVQLDIHVPDAPQQPLMPWVVKAYLDALEGIVYDNDRQIEHLVVHRRGVDHPMMDGYEPEDPETTGQVYLTAMPCEVYTRLYDRAFRKLIFRRGDRSPFRAEWGLANEAKLSKLKAERKTISDGARAEATDDLIAMHEEDRLLAGAFADIDRPGPLSADMRRAFRILPVPAIQSGLRKLAGSRLMLPLPGHGDSGWEDRVGDELKRHAGHRLMARSKLRGWVALDIAVRGESMDGKDLDNLARRIITRFEDAYCVRHGTVASYRAYQAAGSPRGVQLRIMSDNRMLGLEIALGETRRSMVDAIHGPPPRQTAGTGTRT